MIACSNAFVIASTILLISSVSKALIAIVSTSRDTATAQRSLWYAKVIIPSFAIFFFCLSLPAPSFTHVAVGFTVDTGIETPPLYAVLVTRAKIIPVLSSFSTIWLSTVVGITAPTSVLLLTASALYSFGSASPLHTYFINALRYSMLPYLSSLSPSPAAPLKFLSTLCCPLPSPSPSPTLSPAAILASSALRFSAAALIAALSSCKAVTSFSSAVISSSFSSAALVVSSFLIAANLSSISFNLIVMFPFWSWIL